MKWIIFLMTFSTAAFGQRLTEGKIVDADSKKPIPFASIIIVGTSVGFSSNADGQFTLSTLGDVTLKISCVGYESLVVSVSATRQVIELKPVALQLPEVVVFNKTVNPRKVVRKAFANIPNNYVDQPFLQKFFYRHYCKDDSTYGRLIEAFVDVWKDRGYQALQASVRANAEIRVTQLRRSLDNTLMAQGHEPISITNILQADLIAYQTQKRSEHLSFYSELNNLKTDIADYTFTFDGTTSYDDQEVYQISYSYKKDSILMTSGNFQKLMLVSGQLFITMDTQALIKAEELRHLGESQIRTSAYYRKLNGRYYPYQFIREGKNRLADGSSHSFHIDLMSTEIKMEPELKFFGREPDRVELLKIPYDSSFWRMNPVLKATPLEEQIIYDLGGGISLGSQFQLYRQYELNTHEGGKNGEEKFNWYKEFNRGRQSLYLIFWSSDCKSYVMELEAAKRLQKKYRGKVNFVLISLDDDETQWQQTVAKYGLFSDGIINYRIGGASELTRSFQVKETPSFGVILLEGKYAGAKKPSDPQLEVDFKSLPTKKK